MMRIVKNDKRKDIIDSAVRNILKLGYSRTTIENITKHLGIAKGSFYIHFKSKNNIFEEILKDEIEKLTIGEKTIERNTSLFEIFLKEYINFKIKVQEKDMNRELVMIELYKNIDILEPEIKRLIKKIDEMNIRILIKVFHKYKNELNIPEDKYEKYSQMINDIIKNFKAKVFFISLKDRLDFFSYKYEKIIEKIDKKQVNEGTEFLYINVLKLLK